MGRFIVKRIAIVIPQVFLIIVGTFVVLRLLPVDPAPLDGGSSANLVIVKGVAGIFMRSTKV